MRLIDLQVDKPDAFRRLVVSWRPDAILFSCNYLANVPEVIDLAKLARAIAPGAFTCIGGHSASFVAEAILRDGAGAVDCVLKGEGEAGIASLLAAAARDRGAITTVPGVVSETGAGPYRLFDIQHNVLPTRLPLNVFYRKLVETQQVLNRKHFGWSVLREVAGIVAGQLLRGQTNFFKSLWKFNGVYNADRLLADHRREIRHSIPERIVRTNAATTDLYIHAAASRAGASRHVAAQPTAPA